VLKRAKIERLPRAPGVYWFKQGKTILYIGKATSLRDRVGSYLGKNVEAGRGSRISQMVVLADGLGFKPTDSALEALILESQLIKKHQPKYNVQAKDDKSYPYVVITEEDYPRVLMVRGRSKQVADGAIAVSYGPFPQTAELREALKVIRHIFPYRDGCKPGVGRACFNFQLGLCPGVCVGKISKWEYTKVVNRIKLILSGRKKTLTTELTRLMRRASQVRDFEQAAKFRDQLFALKHLADVAVIKNRARDDDFELQDLGRVEAYDVAHFGGKETVGVMTVATAGELRKGEYRKFKLAPSADDLNSLKLVLARRFAHREWSWPELVVVDGGPNQLAATRSVLAKLRPQVSVVAVVKNLQHKPHAVLGLNSITDVALALKYRRPGAKRLILLLNSEAHRFALTWHRTRLRRGNFG